ncbi:hypothetical protein ELQ92_13330 [Labedella populi]|uniref:DUF4190 domain-containing protein n=1 Tax=Labedella populi TaxID=2498850 RepID=A0A3S3ZGX4_9MICO|nr:hypothetical protein [Labedella populi]RWZ59239.1 hypothetical protein ELQ92_13330 [Labedella populi]
MPDSPVPPHSPVPPAYPPALPTPPVTIRDAFAESLSGEPAPATAAASSGPRVGHALGIASLALGVLAVMGSTVPIVNLASVGFAVAGSGLGIAALFLLARGRGLALAGTITSVVALVVSVALAVVYSGVLAATASTALFGWNTSDVYSTGYDDAEETIAPLDDSASDGTFDAPLSLGETVVVTRDGEPRWEITLMDATFDALDEVQTANADIHVSDDLVGGLGQYAYVSAEITYLGDGTATVYNEIYVAFAPTANVAYYPGEVPAVPPGTDLAFAEDIDSGETLEGNVLVALPLGAQDTGRWTVGGEWTDVLYVAAE